jgi:hypothetical protein
MNVSCDKCISGTNACDITALSTVSADVVAMLNSQPVPVVVLGGGGG